ncbi:MULTISPECIES: M1 family metallopeptidase [unclassified Carboxylicivirga]|uniref:M1 family metallopeptidase n=1 Tax=Carboxylicivirga TaxID=1628153 RepID=UPI003D3421ED
MRKTALFLLSLFILLSCSLPEQPMPGEGVSRQLAQRRARLISELHYHLSISVPERADAPIKGQALIQFNLADNQDIYLDFKADNEQLQQLIINNDTLPQPAIINEHIKLSKNQLQEGSNSIAITFLLGDGPLNRNNDYFYALFVPDRARTAIPCFDQPNIKGRFAVSMDLPEGWIGIANGKALTRQGTEGRTQLTFAPSQPISTYLWAFTAGRYHYDSIQWKDKTIGLYHMLDDTLRYQRNIDEIFRQTTASLDWLEEYTAYEYPFDTHNLVAIPSFQFGGMEHPGATYFRSEKLFLDATPSRDEELARANLIAHETAHLWFGDLVTMPWFNEVWLKEVFANFMADKITRPWFPDINHQLRFLMAHFPAAYSIDRTAGANAISQHLDNLKNAGTVYGKIIYHKAPIVMKQLENMAGEENLQRGIREYVAKNTFGNASWNDLISCIDKYTETDLNVWSRAWVNEAGRPVLFFEPSEQDKSWKLKQVAEHEHLAAADTYWPQEINLMQDHQHYRYQMYDANITIDAEPDRLNSLFLADDKGYGLVRLTQPQINYWLDETHTPTNELLRGRLAINLNENFLDSSINPRAFIKYLSHRISEEQNSLLLNQYASQLQSTFWHFIPSAERKTIVAALEDALINRIGKEETVANKKILLRLWSHIYLSKKSEQKLTQLLLGETELEGMPLSENDKMRLLTQLCLRNHPEADSLQQTTLGQLKNRHNREKLRFLLPSLSDKSSERDAFFRSLSLHENRTKEAWVQNALANLHHPLRTAHSIAYLPRTLELLEEIQRKGDIFFPIGWLRNSFGGHSSEAAYLVARQFLDNHPDYPEHLKLKILQNIDMTQRAYLIKDKYRK